MSLSKIKWDKPWGPAKLRETFQWLIKEVNRRSAIPGLGIDVDETDNGRQISSRVFAGQKKQVAGGSAADSPWEVKAGVDSDGDATFTIVSGSVGGIDATGDGITDAPPGHSVDDTAYSIYAKVSVVSTDGTDNYRAHATAVVVGTDNDEFAGDVGVLIPFELHVQWDDPDTKDAGYFYVKIADIQGAGSPIVVTELIQALNDNILSFVIAGDEVVIL